MMLWPLVSVLEPISLGTFMVSPNSTYSLYLFQPDYILIMHWPKWIIYSNFITTWRKRYIFVVRSWAFLEVLVIRRSLIHNLEKSSHTCFVALVPVSYGWNRNVSTNMLIIFATQNKQCWLNQDRLPISSE